MCDKKYDVVIVPASYSDNMWAVDIRATYQKKYFFGMFTKKVVEYKPVEAHDEHDIKSMWMNSLKWTATRGTGRRFDTYEDAEVFAEHAMDHFLKMETELEAKKKFVEMDDIVYEKPNADIV
jgi:hypothetical protein